MIAIIFELPLFFEPCQVFS